MHCTSAPPPHEPGPPCTPHLDVRHVTLGRGSDVGVAEPPAAAAVTQGASGGAATQLRCVACRGNWGQQRGHVLCSHMCGVPLQGSG